jgi:aminoglycoside phosphotransferase (APT) family kinase protein
MRSQLEARVPALARPEFVARHIRPLLGDRASKAGCQVEIIRNGGTPRMTLRYAFGDDVTVYGKVYTDGGGPARYSVLRRLWENGFGPGSSLRVPEPLGFCAEENLLLMRAVRGRPLASLLLHEPIEQVLPGVQGAARWLARLHASALADIPREPACNRVKAFELADRLGKAAAAHPADVTMLLDCLQRLRTLTPDTLIALVLTHGQYTPANVFVDGPDLVVIDLDRVSLSDQAKDVALFLSRMSALRAKEAGRSAEAEQLVDEFLDVYRTEAPLPLENILYYTALFALNAFAKCAKDHAAGEPVRQRIEALHFIRFKRCFAGEAASQADLAAPRADCPSTVGSIADLVTRSLIRHLQPVCGRDVSTHECNATLVQNTGTGRVTIRYEFDVARVVFAKRYADSLGAHSYQVQQTFWKGGFGKDSRFRVPEPVAFDKEQNLFVMRECPGTPLAALLGEPSGEWDTGVREAARWLAAFHCSSLRVGDPEPEWESLKTFRLATRLVKAAAARPAECRHLLDLMQMLKERFASLPEGRTIVQTHGRFHHDHVFLSPEAVTVIDLDRSRPADPAKDVAEFVRVLRIAAFRAGVNEGLTEEITNAFLAEYLGLVPRAEAALPHYWLSFVVLSYLGHLRKAASGGASSAVTAFHEREIRRVSEMRP